MDNPGRSKLVNSLIESIRSASNKKTNLADPIIAAIRRTVPNRRNVSTGTNNNNRRNMGAGANNNNRRNTGTGTNNHRNMGTGTNNWVPTRRNTVTNNWFPRRINVSTGTNNWVPRRRNMSTGTNNNWVPRRRNVSNNYNLFSRRRTPNYNYSVNRMRTPNFETNNSSVNRMRTSNFENGRENNNGSVNIRRSPKFENNQIRGRLPSLIPRHLPTFDTAMTSSPGTKTIHPGMGLKVLKNVLDTTPKRYLRKVIKREASTRKAKKLLPKKKKFLVEYVQSEIRPKKRKSSAQVLI
jgi:hypothetical protein